MTALAAVADGDCPGDLLDDYERFVDSICVNSLGSRGGRNTAVRQSVGAGRVLRRGSSSRGSCGAAS